MFDNINVMKMESKSQLLLFYQGYAIFSKFHLVTF